MRVLLVDDEPLVRKSVERLLNRVEPEWEVRSAPSAAQAIALLERHEIDVVVSDLDLGTAGMTGAELLAFVQERSPEIVRVVLTGAAEPELAQRSVSSAHLMMTKPFDALQLRAQLRRAASLRSLLTDVRIRSLVGASNRLPSPPKTFHEIAVALSGRRASVDDVATLIERDIALTAQLIRLVSSAYFGLPRRVRSVRGAVAYLGFQTVKTLVLSASIVEQHRPSRAIRGFDIEEMQRLALRSAHIAREMLAGMGSTDTGFSAAMLQNVGQLLLASRAPEAYADVLSREREGVPAEAGEKIVFGASHADVGAYLLGIWGLPQGLIQGVAHHHRPQREASSRLGVVLAVNIAQKLARDPEAPAVEDAAGDPSLIDLGHLEELGVAGRLASWRAVAGRLSAREGNAE